MGSLREGLVGAISGGVSGSTMIIPVLPFESIMTFQAAGGMPGQPSMLDVARELYRCVGLSALLSPSSRAPALVPSPPPTPFVQRTAARQQGMSPASPVAARCPQARRDQAVLQGPRCDLGDRPDREGRAILLVRRPKGALGQLRRQ